MKNKHITTLIATGLLTLSTTTLADSDEGKFALGLGVGTTGATISGTFNLSESTNIRAIYASYSDSLSETDSGIAYDYEIDLSSFSVLLDWHPFDGGFRVSAGAVSNGNEFKGTAAQGTGNTTVGNQSFSNAQLGTLRAQVDSDGVVPYLGVGWGNAVGKGSALSFSLDLGVIFQGQPDVTLTTEGTDASILAAVNTQLAVEKAQLESDLDDFKLYPVLNVGVNYRF